MVSDALFFDLVEESLVDIAFAGVGRKEVPQVADLALSDAVDAAEALFNAVGVPGKVVVDHEVRALEVESFSCGVGGDEDSDILVLSECLLDLAAIFALDAAVDGDDCFVPADHGADLVDEVVQGVAVFGEHDDLARIAGVVERQCIVVEDGA